MNWISKLVKGKYDEKTQTIGKKESRKKRIGSKRNRSNREKEPIKLNSLT